MVETLHGIIYKNYMLHYNFPPYSVGECKRVGSVSRREIGHGHLAERSLYPILPHPEDFPYTIRIVSEIMESNGSSSMASVCGGSMALMDAGVPTKCHVAGIAMGLISEGDSVQILSDITGTEDHLGDMDFKVTGTKEGITAFQMDIKIKGITPELMGKAMAQAKVGRDHIIGEMEKNLPEPRTELSEKAPVIMSFTIDQKKIRDVIGPGGQVIRGIQEATGATISINDDGQVSISAVGKEKGQKAREMVEEIIAEAEPGKIYDGKVKRVTSFGAFVEILPGKEGLLHISELAAERVEKVEDVLNVGDDVRVKCLEIDPRGRINLSKKAFEA
jgi:polyribonucleotide nucleotidyltransferase